MCATLQIKLDAYLLVTDLKELKYALKPQCKAVYANVVAKMFAFYNNVPRDKNAPTPTEAAAAHTENSAK